MLIECMLSSRLVSELNAERGWLSSYIGGPKRFSAMTFGGFPILNRPDGEVDTLCIITIVNVLTGEKFELSEKRERSYIALRPFVKNLEVRLNGNSTNQINFGLRKIPSTGGVLHEVQIEIL